MELILAVVIGVLYAAGVYSLLRRSLVKLILGLGFLAHATNLLIFMVGGLQRGAPALIPPDATGLQPPFADPLPQALILTAIVIGFGAQAFAAVLLKRVHARIGTDDLDAIKQAYQELSLEPVWDEELEA